MIVMPYNLDYSNAPSDPASLYLFTGNSYVKRNGALVMGRGAARAVRDMYPGIDHQFGKQMTHLGFYGVLFAEGTNLGVFQVKRSYDSEAELKLIVDSLVYLDAIVKGPYKDRAVHMNYPGIGNGRLPEAAVAPFLSELPDNVYIYKG